MPHLNTPGQRRGSYCIQRTAMDRFHVRIGPGGLAESVNMIVITLTATVVLSSLVGKTFQNYFLYVWFGRQNFSLHRP